LTNVLSTNFKIESCDGKKKLTQDFWNGMRERSEPVIKAFTKNGTKITFTPDYEFFKLSGLDPDHILRIQKKVIDAAANNLNIKFYFNGELIKFKSFDDYVALYSDNYFTDNSEDWNVGITDSDGFEQISFINSVETYQGGTHVNYVVDQITNKLREHFKKKHKVDVKPSDIKNHFRIFISGTVNRPRFSSQTKENMISPASEWKTSWTVSDKFIKGVLKSEIIQSILDWVQAKEKATELAELRKANKNLDKADPRRVDKFHDASTKQRSDAMLFLAEGDCLEEHSELIIQTENGFISKEIKDVSVGDKVISHTGKVQEITNKQHRLKPVLNISTNIGNIQCTKEHKIYVYDVLKKDFYFIEAQYLDKSIHKLVKGKFMDYDFISKIKDIIQVQGDPIYDLEFIINDGEYLKSIKSSLSHKFGCFDYIDNKFVFIEAKDILKNRHVFLYKNI
jgi:DNA topoisomerase-2